MIASSLMPFKKKSTQNATLGPASKARLNSTGTTLSLILPAGSTVSYPQGTPCGIGDAIYLRLIGLRERVYVASEEPNTAVALAGHV